MTILTLIPDATAGIDTQILNGSAATLNYGVRTTMSAGNSTGSDKDRALIKFDFSALPAGAVVTSAVLSLYCTAQGSGTDYNIFIHRSLVQWFEGIRNSVNPSEDGSTWNLRNDNGSVAWAGGAGGASGSDWDAVATATTLITTTGQYFDFDVTADLQDWVNEVNTNHGWWILGDESTTSTYKTFATSDFGVDNTQRPKLVIEYSEGIFGSASGTVTVTGTLIGVGTLAGNSAGIAAVSGTMISNQNILGSAAGASTASAFLGARVYIQGNSFGDSTAVADIKASYHSVGSAAGTSSHAAHLKGIFQMEGLAAGMGSLLATPSFQGQLRGSSEGTSDTTGTGYARAKSVATVIGCNPVPLFYITDGSTRSNGQLNILNFLSERSGYMLRNYKPQVSQYKDGGRWSSSPQSQGRRMRSRSFDNAIDILEVAAVASSQDALIDYQQDLLGFQEAAADYWASEYPMLPYYLVARAARESNIRYAVIHMMSTPELENPYSQPFFDHDKAAFESLTIRIERGHWLSTPPGKFDCVELSNQREWTVSGWQAGS